ESLETFDPSKKAGASLHLRARWRKVSPYRNWALGLVLVVIALAAGFLIRSRFAPAPAVAHAPVTVLVADFTNHTGDSVFDGALEPVVKLALEGATFINVYDRTRMRADLGLPPI